MDAFDVIVVGSGGAGLTAAWYARTAGASVLVVNKGFAGRTGSTITTGGGISVAGESLCAHGLPGDAGDREADFFADTLRAGQFLGDQRLVEAMVTGVGAEVRRLADLGAPLRFPPRAPGHSSGRGVLLDGPPMQRLLVREAVRAGVRFAENIQATGILRDGGGRAVGLAALDRAAGESVVIRGGAVILATGGSTANWSLRTAPEELSGDGHAMALEAGAALIEMEMLQFLPCCLTAPDIWRGLQFPWIIGPQAGIRAWLLNRYGERFMARWDPERMELATRDLVSLGSAWEVAEGRGSPNGGVYLSWAHLPRDILDHAHEIVGSVSRDWRWQGFDMTPLIGRIRAGHAIEVAPAAHFSMGGIRIGPDGATAVPGLYACGEAAGGLHGANRLSGNAGAQILVQGKAAGQNAARFVRTAGPGDAPRNTAELLDRLHAPRHQTGGPVPAEVKAALTGLAERALSPVRGGETLDAALADLRALAADALPRLSLRTAERRWNRDWFDALDCAAAVPVLEAALLAARARRRSIGAHYRRDGAGEPDGVLSHGIIRRTGTTLDHRFVPVAFPLTEPVP